MPPDPVVLLAPESFFGEWQAEIVPRDQYPGFDFFDVGDAQAVEGGPQVLGGYALPELSRLTASAEQISGNLAELSERLEIAFNDETANNLAQAIADIAAISQQVRDLVDTQSTVAGTLTASADSALQEIEEASRAARRSFQRMEGLLGDAQVDSIVTNVRLATASIQELSANLSSASGGMGRTMQQADSAFARLDRLTARVEAGEGTIGRLFADSTLALKTEDVLQQLNLLLEDLRQNPRRYVRLSIF
jgi:phospholipid/cholesterol/gamma-HCH transport system substrate-binding protein